MLSGRYTTLSGKARRGDLPDTVTFVSDESVLDAAADIRMDVARTVTLVGRVALRHEDRLRRDQIAALSSDLESWTTGLGVAAAYRPSPGFALAGGAAFATYGAGGGIPDPTDLGVAYRTYVAPELSLQATDARAWAGTLSALWSVLPGGAVWLRLAPTGLASATGRAQLPSLPPGERTGWTLEAGIVVRGAGNGAR